MEQALNDIAGKYTFFAIPIIVGLLSSFIVAAIDYITPEKIKGKWLLTLLSVLIGFGLAFAFPTIAVWWLDILILAVLNASSALLFFHLGGRKMIDKLIKTFINKIQNKAEEL